MTFKEVVVSHSKHFLIPQDIDIIVPPPDDVADVEEKYIHSLAYIPWSDKYLNLVPVGYQDLYKSILPKLNVRTTDVHSAFSVSFVDELIELSAQEVDRHILIIAVLLHDIGWGQLTAAQIALSLNYSAFTYTDEALIPKRLHALRGAEVASEVLEKYIGLHLSHEEKSYISKLVRYHDQIDPWPDKPEPIEYLLLGDADRLWSYTHENFWLDTIRKDTQPTEYLTNITEAIDNYFLTEYGKIIARKCASQLAVEVRSLDHTK